MSNKKTVALVVLAIVLTIGGAAFLFARIFLIKMSRVPTGSMRNTIIPGDHILSVKLFGNPERGSVVIFQYPPGTDERDPEGAAVYVARIAGLPGERIQLRGNMVYINDRPLEEKKSLVTEDEQYGPLTVISTEGNGPYQVFYTKGAEEPVDELTVGTTTPFLIPTDNYFLLADHRDNALDSRYRGPVPRNLIWGKATLIYMSVSEDSGELRSDRTFQRIE